MPFNCTASLKYKSILTSILNLYILADNLTESGVEYKFRYKLQ